MLQEALVQDGGSVKTTSRYTRMVAYDVSDPTVQRPTLVGEWIVPLPVSASKNTTRASSEIHFVSENIFFSLSRDGNGNGDGNTTDDTTSKYKYVLILGIPFLAYIVHPDKPTFSVLPAPRILLILSLMILLTRLHQMGHSSTQSLLPPMYPSLITSTMSRSHDSVFTMVN